MVRVSRPCCEECIHPFDPAHCVRRLLCPCHAQAMTDEEYRAYLKEAGL